MRRYVAVVAVLAVVVGVLGMIAPVSSQSPGQRMTITLFDPNKTNWEKNLDLGRKGDSPGDMNIFVDAIFDPETCEKSGNALGRFQISKFVGKRDAWFHVDVTVRLSDGSLQVLHGGRFTDFDNELRGRFSVVGGSGAYKDATGEMSLQEDVEMCGKRGALLTFDIGGVQ